MTATEWSRGALLNLVSRPAPTAWQVAAMAELMALRIILLNVTKQLATDGRISAEAMREIINHADNRKLEKAEDALRAAWEQAYSSAG
jgi:DNA-binding GntR family transcriptional regulator